VTAIRVPAGDDTVVGTDGVEDIGEERNGECRRFRPAAGTGNGGSDSGPSRHGYGSFPVIVGVLVW
jgi:hypothetical protein